MKVDYNIDGMTCAACVAAVEKTVNKLDGIDNVEVNLLTKSMVVEFDDSKVDSASIVKSVQSAGYDADEKSSDGAKAKTVDTTDIYKKDLENMKMRLIVSMLFMLPLMYIAMGEMMGLPLPAILVGDNHRLVNIFFQFLLTLPVIYVNRSFYISGFKSLFNRTPNMDSLIAIGSGAALVYGIYTIFQLILAYSYQNMEMVHKYAHDVYFESAAMILALITLGKYLETRSKRKTSNAISKLMDLAPKFANVERNGEIIQISVDDLVIGDIIVIKPGESIPVDGVVVEGMSSIDQSALTGESIPVEKVSGDTVYAATINKTGSFKFSATKVGADTTLAKIVELVKDASASKAPIAKMADKVAGVFVPIVIVIAIVSTIVWIALGESFEFALSIGIAVLVISCPCALGLATPVAIMVGTGKGASNGILIKSAEALEVLHSVSTVVLDKTGTITRGIPYVTDIITIGDIDEDEFVKIATSLEQFSEHPLADAINRYANDIGIKSYSVENFNASSGLGVSGDVNGEEIIAGNIKFINQNGLNSDDVVEIADRLANEGKTPMYFASKNKILGIIAVADIIKPNSKDAIDALKKAGIKTVMLTGDNEKTANAIRDKINIDRVVAEVLPEDKEGLIAELKDSGEVVAMVGDGINDAPALARANVGIAIGAGTDIAIESADIVLMKSDLFDVVNAINLSKATIKNIKQNLFWAFFYNTLGIPVAAGVFYTALGWKLSPMIGAAAMSLSSIFVVTNALRLNTFKFLKANSETEEISENVVNHNRIDNIEVDTTGGKDKMKKVMHIEGMTCGHCSGRVEKALNATEGVKAKVVLEDNIAEVEIDDSITDEMLKTVVEDAGYEVTSIE
ncbi:MAG: heavy metal translocating P-type ATPase [Tissierellia bacterium]|nr:heavy metal translocating P-type ATPase [Tissierellia bacterium]